MEVVTEKAVSWLVPFILGSMVGGITLWFTVLRGLLIGVQCLLRAEIIRQNEKWTKALHCPIYAKQALSRAYKAYHWLRGNDVATTLYEEVMELPERKEQ